MAQPFARSVDRATKQYFYHVLIGDFVNELFKLYIFLNAKFHQLFKSVFRFLIYYMVFQATVRERRSPRIDPLMVAAIDVLIILMAPGLAELSSSKMYFIKALR